MIVNKTQIMLISTSRLTLPALLSATLMGFLDLFVVIVALPSISAGLHAPAETAQLVLSSYVVAYGATLVLGGRLGDRIGRRRIFVGGMAGFVVASLGCALAPSIWVLIAVRTLQGIAGGLMLPQVLATIQAAYAEPRRGRAILAYTTCIGLASTTGQVLGGGLIDLNPGGLGWRTLFLINLPIGALGMWAARRAVPETSAPASGRLDLPGAVVLAVGLVALLVGLSVAPTDGWAAWAVAVAVAGVGVTACLIPVERRAAVPLLPGRILTRRPVRLGLVATVTFYAASNTAFLSLSYFMQFGLGHSPLVAGLAFAPMGVAFMASTLHGRRSAAPGGPRAMLHGALIMSVGLAGALVLGLTGAGAVWVAFVLVLYGAGQGSVYPALVATVLSRVQAGDEGAATGVLLTVTQISNAAGVALISGVWAASAGLTADDALAVGMAITLALTLVTAIIAAVLVRVSPPLHAVRASAKAPPAGGRGSAAGRADAVGRRA